MIIRNNYIEEYSKEKSELILKENFSSNKKAIFLDRDGVLIEDVNRIDDISKVKLCKNVLPFLEFAHKNNFDLNIVTNQSSVSRGIINYTKYIEITEYFLAKLPKYLYPNFIIASFHLPDNKNNLKKFSWRKPGTGMFERILKQKKYNTYESFMIGDKLTDLIPANKCNIKNLLYIKSNLHKNQIYEVKKWNKDNKQKIKIIDNLDSHYIEQLMLT